MDVYDFSCQLTSYFSEDIFWSYHHLVYIKQLHCGQKAENTQKKNQMHSRGGKNKQIWKVKNNDKNIIINTNYIVADPSKNSKLQTVSGKFLNVLTIQNSKHFFDICTALIEYIYVIMSFLSVAPPIVLRLLICFCTHYGATWRNSIFLLSVK